MARAENLNRAVETLTLEVSALQSQRQSHDMTHQQLSAKVAELEAAKAKVIGDRESAISQVTEKMLLQVCGRVGATTSPRHTHNTASPYSHSSKPQKRNAR